MSLRLVIMGVSGAGKSSVGAAVADLTGVRYLDGDDLHPPENVAKMAAGVPLEDADRWGWLDRVAAGLSSQAPLIIGCSALKRSYRDRIRAGAGGRVHFAYLAGDFPLLAGRMAQRTGHYMPPALLESQFAALEPPGADEAWQLDVALPVAALAAQIAALIRAEAG